MRILQVVVGYHPARGEFGGIVETVEHLSNELVRRGHAVEVWTTALLGRGLPLARRDVTAQRGGVTIRYFRAYHPAQLGFGFAFSPSFARTIRRALAERRFDVVHANGYRNHLALSTFLACQAAGVPYVVQPHGTVPPGLHRVRVKGAFDRVMGRRFLKGAAAVLAISRAEAAVFSGIGVAPDAVDVVYNGLDLGMLAADLGPGDWFRRELSVPERDVLLFLGRYHERKGAQHLVDAFARLAPLRPDLRLVLIGADDGYEAALRARVAASPARDRITLSGPAYGLAKYRAYRSAALVVYPAVHEYFGLVPFEALLCGTPAVATAGEGCAEVLDEVQGGWTAPYGDPDALARVIGDALAARDAAPAAWAARTAGARQRILDRFTWEAVTDHILTIYRRAVGAGGTR